MKIGLNILFLTEYGGMGGAEHSLFRLVIGLKNKGHSPIVAVPSDTDLLCRLLENDIEVVPMDIPRLKGKDIFRAPYNVLIFIRSILKIVKLKSIDVVYSNTTRTRLYLSLLSFLGNIYKFKSVCHIRDINNNPFEKILLSQINRTIVISQSVKDNVLFNSGVKYLDKIDLVYNGVEDLSSYLPKEDIRNKFNISKDSFIIGMIGRVEDWKRQDLFISAALKLLKFNDNLIFFLVGDAFKTEHVEYKNTIIKMMRGYEDRIVFTGYVDNPFDYLYIFDMLICPSDNEPFGRVVIEAMAMKKMVVCSNSGGISEILKNFPAQLFSPGSLDDLVLKVKNSFTKDNAKLREDLYEEYINRFELDKCTSKIESILIKLKYKHR